MKSIIEEASSLSKAIDQAWQRAGKPQEFSIKVFEESQRNMFGITVRSAKIALFFDEKIITGSTEQPKSKPEYKPQRPTQEKIHTHQKSAPHHEQATDNRPPRSSEKPSVKEHPKRVSGKSQPRKQKPVWSDELIDTTKTWLNTALSIMGLSHVSYETSIIGNNLNIQFNEKLLTTDQNERWLFSSFAHLIMLGLGQSFKKRFPHLKIILKSSN